MSTLVIRKKSLKTWEHYLDDKPLFISSKFFFNTPQGFKFQIVEEGKATLGAVAIEDITLYDDSTGGGAETFATVTQLSIRLEALDYTGHYRNGDISVGSLISADAGNDLVLGTDGLLYVVAGGGGGGGSSPFVQESNGAIHRADVVDTLGGINSTNLSYFSGATSGDYSHSDSNGVADGESSHADSVGTASGDYSHADSNGTANGYSSHADSFATANGDYSNASGNEVFSNSYSETAVGCYNEDVTANDATAWNEEDLAFSIGIGEDGGSRLTSFFAYKNGGFKFIARALSNITNAVAGFFALDENARPNVHDGSNWNQLAYVSDLDFIRKPIAIEQGNNTVTGTTAETIISSLLIPANTLQSLCDLFLFFDYGKSNAASIPIKVYRNTSNSLSGATQIGLYTTASNRNGGFARKFKLRGTTLDLMSSSSASLLSNINVDLLFAATETQTIAPTADIYFLITCTNDATGTVFTHKSSILEMQKL